MRIKVLRQKKADLLIEAGQLAAKLDAGNITPEELARLNRITSATAATATSAEIPSELAQVNAEIAREEVLMDERRSMESATNISADTPAERGARVPAEPKREPEKFGSFGEQMMAIARAAVPGGSVDRRLVMSQVAGPTGINESVGSEGAFLVQSDFQDGLLDDLYAGGDILNLINPGKISLGANSNGIRLNGVDETSRANGSRAGGIQAFWTAEAGQKAASQPKFRQISMELDKLTGLCYATDESLQDAAILEPWIKEAFNTEFTFKLEDAIINGTGAGMPLGILNSGALVTVAKEAGQANGTVLAMNILKMWSRLPMRNRKNAIWLINQDVEPMLGTFSLPVQNVAGTENVGGIPSYAVRYEAPNGDAFGRLQSRPVIPTEYNNTLGGLGDIILCDPTAYLAIDKGQMQQASSIHVRFIYDETAFRFVYRFNGQPKWRTARTPYKGANSQSPFVTLQAR
ncbi:phage major capsid protein [Bradyrhizobium sp. 174]|uniref:phage major capsid protein n=1 Tax=Bradyrhizobium sp. 174 TaxID=2782645 RepID=UPI001FF83ABB|nr:phage major capsid protein [Bradyrhizobium sp. 174]MCK1577808.1 phage major capsid protein [Bradyrhizobium sp. 174]